MRFTNQHTEYKSTSDVQINFQSITKSIAGVQINSRGTNQHACEGQINIQSTIQHSGYKSTSWVHSNTQEKSQHAIHKSTSGVQIGTTTTSAVQFNFSGINQHPGYNSISGVLQYRMRVTNQHLEY